MNPPMGARPDLFELERQRAVLRLFADIEARALMIRRLTRRSTKRIALEAVQCEKRMAMMRLELGLGDGEYRGL
ncbi:MAG: hypothetical protein H2045_09175 [Rhizobiales bacterium]|nr:hypothetical protein [Hyphomicrobiales bacterium]